MPSAQGMFEVALTPGEPEVGGAVGRFDFTKTFHGELEGTGEGVLLSCGDPETGAAGYVAIETVTGHLGGRAGGFALQQLGMMHAGTQTLHYEVVPGSGDGDLAGITGTFHLTVDELGTHHYTLDYHV